MELMSTVCDGRWTSQRIRSTRFVPPAMNFASMRDPAFTADGMSRSRTKSNGCIAGLLRRFDDAEVAAAAADVAAHPLTDVVIRFHVAFANQRHRGADLSRSAVAALESVVADEGRLDRLQASIAGQPFDGDAFLSAVHRRQRETRNDATPVDEHRARAARALIASFLRAGDVEMLAQRVEETRSRVEFQLVHLSVDVERHRNRVGIGLLRRGCVFQRLFAEEGSHQESGGGGRRFDHECSPRRIVGLVIVRLVTRGKSHGPLLYPYRLCIDSQFCFCLQLPRSPTISWSRIFAFMTARRWRRCASITSPSERRAKTMSCSSF